MEDSGPVTLDTKRVGNTSSHYKFVQTWRGQSGDSVSEYIKQPFTSLSDFDAAFIYFWFPPKPTEGPAIGQLVAFSRQHIDGEYDVSFPALHHRYRTQV